ncbi:hypothetical protein J2Y60_003573 [Arcicella sp. BE140]|nr:hypothetical protein [Arcicella sp. BE51]MDR6813362.1 hypothetical protein [Arcicella sp. BE140]MDR6824675.1 hypothetical protein [Arcicella sp. BE139]
MIDRSQRIVDLPKIITGKPPFGIGSVFTISPLPIICS